MREEYREFADKIWKSSTKDEFLRLASESAERLVGSLFYEHITGDIIGRAGLFNAGKEACETMVRAEKLFKDRGQKPPEAAPSKGEEPAAPEPSRASMLEMD